MTIAFTNKTQGFNSSGLNPVVTASVAYSNNTLYLVSVASRTTATIDSVTGGGITWVRIAQGPSAQGKAAIFRGLVTSGASTGTLSIAFTGTLTCSMWSVDEVTGASSSGTNGSGAIVQSVAQGSGSATSESVPLASFADVTNNAAFACIWHTAQEVTTHESGWTELADQASGVGLGMTVEYKVGEDLTATASWVTSTFKGGVALEVTPNDPAKVPVRRYNQSQAVQRSTRW